MALFKGKVRRLKTRSDKGKKHKYRKRKESGKRRYSYKSKWLKRLGA